ncbi:hypothetical protein EDD11_009113 [Mortierella claussenii]|nr:hypothetical protein EDD11_009113 [Mortierella claussenii]
MSDEEEWYQGSEIDLEAATITCQSPNGGIHQPGDALTLQWTDNGIWPRATDVSSASATVICSSNSKQLVEVSAIQNGQSWTLTQNLMLGCPGSQIHVEYSGKTWDLLHLVAFHNFKAKCGDLTVTAPPVTTTTMTTIMTTTVATTTTTLHMTTTSIPTTISTTLTTVMTLTSLSRTTTLPTNTSSARPSTPDQGGTQTTTTPSKVNVTAAVLGTLGGLAVVALIIFGLVIARRRKQLLQEKRWLSLEQERLNYGRVTEAGGVGGMGSSSTSAWGGSGPSGAAGGSRGYDQNVSLRSLDLYDHRQHYPQQHAMPMPMQEYHPAVAAGTGAGAGAIAMTMQHHPHRRPTLPNGAGASPPLPPLPPQTLPSVAVESQYRGEFDPTYFDNMSGPPTAAVATADASRYGYGYGYGRDDPQYDEYGYELVAAPVPAGARAGTMGAVGSRGGYGTAAGSGGLNGYMSEEQRYHHGSETQSPYSSYPLAHQGQALEQRQPARGDDKDEPQGLAVVATPQPIDRDYYGRLHSIELPSMPLPPAAAGTVAKSPNGTNMMETFAGQGGGASDPSVGADGELGADLRLSQNVQTRMVNHQAPQEILPEMGHPPLQFDATAK